MEQEQEAKDEKFINILLLGETGVGKSTFINAVGNYSKYRDIKEAQAGELVHLVPSKYVVRDKFGESHEVQVGGEDKNECFDIGRSATQDVKSYVVPTKGSVKLRFIDTPGIGDGRGIGQDNINCESILNYIGQLHELHAILYFFKPTDSRITIYFEYCMSQILSRLDKSASRNMIFIFTNTRGTDYGPGDTFFSLKKVIGDIKAKPPHVDIPLGKNVFCFDNEVFRYLTAVKRGVPFELSVKQANRSSWKYSCEKWNGLLKYIIGDKDTPPLEPHLVQSTKAVNEARRLITLLSQPLAEIFQLISDNLIALERHKELLTTENDDIEELKKKLYIPSLDIDIIQLDAPATICHGAKCSELYKIGGFNKWHYKQVCHEVCYLKNVPKELVGSPELQNCEVIDAWNGICSACQCHYSEHAHIYFITKTVENKKEDRGIRKHIDDKEQIMRDIVDLLCEISERQKEMEHEHGVILNICAKFAYFLQNNAITPFSDSYKDYLEYIITREMSLGALTNMNVVHYLWKLLQEYEEEKKSFDTACSIENGLSISPEDIQKDIEDLWNLKYNGKRIKELFDCLAESRSKEYVAQL